MMEEQEISILKCQKNVNRLQFERVFMTNPISNVFYAGTQTLIPTDFDKQSLFLMSSGKRRHPSLSSFTR